MNLFNQLNHRYGQSCIEEVRSWEGKEQKLTRHKCHLHFNLMMSEPEYCSKRSKIEHQTVLNVSGKENHLQNPQIYTKQPCQVLQ